MADMDAFTVHESMSGVTPALSLFDPRQGGSLVFRSKEALLTVEECSRVVNHVEAFIERDRGGQWGTVRKSSVPTTDVAVEDIPILRPWLRELLQTRPACLPACDLDNPILTRVGYIAWLPLT